MKLLIFMLIGIVRGIPNLECRKKIVEVDGALYGLLNENPVCKNGIQEKTLLPLNWEIGRHVSLEILEAFTRKYGSNYSIILREEGGEEGGGEEGEEGEEGGGEGILYYGKTVDGRYYSGTKCNSRIVIRHVECAWSDISSECVMGHYCPEKTIDYYDFYWKKFQKMEDLSQIEIGLLYFNDDYAD